MRSACYFDVLAVAVVGSSLIECAFTFPFSVEMLPSYGWYPGFSMRTWTISTWLIIRCTSPGLTRLNRALVVTATLCSRIGVVPSSVFVLSTALIWYTVAPAGSLSIVTLRTLKS